MIRLALHSWMAMFFLAAAYTKLTEPMDILALLMGWPSATTPQVVRAVGWIELTLAVTQLGPLLFRSLPARALAIASTMVLSVNAAAMTLLYVVRRDPGLATTNVALLILAAGILLAYRPRAAPTGEP